MKFHTINPANNSIIQEYTLSSPEESVTIARDVYSEYSRWKNTTFVERSALLYSLAGELRKQELFFAELMAMEMGKPILQGKAEVEKCAWACEYYADNAEQFLKPEIIKTEAHYSGVAYSPIGTIFGIMPWNFPLWQVIRFLAPTLMAGNTIVLKHALNVTGCALALEECLINTGFPKNVFRNIVCNHDVAAEIIGLKEIAAVTLTGSTRAGKTVARIAGSHIKKCVLELGGSDAYVILADADLEQASTECVNSRLINTGQSCIAAKRFIVVPEIGEEFTQLFKQKFLQKTYGNPFDGNFDCGPMARTDLRNELHSQVQESVQKGAQCILGGYIPESIGAYYPPTLLTNSTREMPAYSEELFGPVASIIKAQNEEDAFRIANDTPFGLGGAVFTQDHERGKFLAEKYMESGACFVNTFVKSDPRLPFGGIKESGYGRELSLFGIREFVNIKTIYVK